MTRRLETPEETRERLEQRGLSERERAELWARVEVSTHKRKPRPWLVPIGVMSMAAALLYFSTEPAEPAPRVATPVQPDPCALDPNAKELTLPAQCGARAVQIAGDEWKLEQGARVTRVENGARVEQGRVQFHVRPRKKPGDAPFIVTVSHAQVRVIGTRFAIDQRAGHGSVQVSEGVIEVSFDDGSIQRVAAGKSTSWPRVTITPPAPPETSVAPTTRTVKGVDLDGVMERLLVLRSQKRFPEAVTLLRGTLSANGLGSAQRERISYELGLALESSGASSCKHWQEHLARFGGQRHAAVVSKVERCAQE